MTNTIIQLRRDVSQIWASSNPILSQGEPGVELDTGLIKIGDGVRRWNSLPYSKITSTILLEEHIASLFPHPVYDDGPSLSLLYENKKV